MEKLDAESTMRVISELFTRCTKIEMALEVAMTRLENLARYSTTSVMAKEILDEIKSVLGEK